MELNGTTSTVLPALMPSQHAGTDALAARRQPAPPGPCTPTAADSNGRDDHPPRPAGAGQSRACLNLWLSMADADLAITVVDSTSYHDDPSHHLTSSARCYTTASLIVTSRLINHISEWTSIPKIARCQQKRTDIYRIHATQMHRETRKLIMENQYFGLHRLWDSRTQVMLVRINFLFCSPVSVIWFQHATTRPATN